MQYMKKKQENVQARFKILVLCVAWKQAKYCMGVMLMVPQLYSVVKKCI